MQTKLLQVQAIRMRTGLAHNIPFEAAILTQGTSKAPANLAMPLVPGAQGSAGTNPEPSC